MADGMGCKCAAYSAAECGCGVDWTPQIVYDQQDEIQRLKAALHDAISRPKGVVPDSALPFYNESMGDMSRCFSPKDETTHGASKQE